MFYKKVNYDSNKECFEFLTNHFTYDTLNSWNGLKSIANNVKVYNLPVNYELAMKALEEDDYFNINMTIHDWEENHPGYKVGFNGRSGGYLVLYNSENNRHCFDEQFTPCDYDDYESFKQDVIDYFGSFKNYHEYLISQVKLVQDFDKLCDDLIEVLKSLIEDMQSRESRTYKWKATKRHEHYVYDTVEDLRHHKEYMLQCGARLFDESEDDLYVEYEVDNYVEGEVTYESK